MRSMAIEHVVSRLLIKDIKNWLINKLSTFKLLNCSLSKKDMKL